MVNETRNVTLFSSFPAPSTGHHGRSLCASLDPRLEGATRVCVQGTNYGTLIEATSLREQREGVVYLGRVHASTLDRRELLESVFKL